MRILLLTHYFAPEFGAPQRRWSALIQRFIAAGHEVAVIAPPPHYPAGRVSPAHRAAHPVGGVERGEHGELILRTAYLMHGGGIASRSADHAVASADAVRRALLRFDRRRDRPDVIISTAPAITSLGAGSLLARRWGVPLVAEMRDAWPDLVTHVGPTLGPTGAPAGVPAAGPTGAPTAGPAGVPVAGAASGPTGAPAAGAATGADRSGKAGAGTIASGTPPSPAEGASSTRASSPAPSSSASRAPASSPSRTSTSAAPRTSASSPSHTPASSPAPSPAAPRTPAPSSSRAAVPGVDTAVAAFKRYGPARASRRALRLLVRLAKQQVHEEITRRQRSARAVVTTTERFADVLRKRGVPVVHVVRNGADLDRVTMPADHPDGDHPELRCVYLGNMGRSQGLETIVRAAARLQAEGVPVRVRMHGHGVDGEHLARLVRRLHAPVEIGERLPHSTIAREYQWADTVIVSLRDWEPFSWTIPSKLYELLAVGRHVTALVAGEAADIVQAAGAGDVLPPGDEDALVELWRALAADRQRTRVRISGREWIRANADDDLLARRYLEILQRIMQERPWPTGRARLPHVP